MLDFEDPPSMDSNWNAPLQLLSKRRLLRWRQVGVATKWPPPSLQVYITPPPIVIILCIPV